MSNPDEVTEARKVALDAIKLRVFGVDKPDIKYVKLEDKKPVVLYFEDWSKKNEHDEFVNMWEEEIENPDDGKKYKVAVFRVLDLTKGAAQEPKTLSVSSKRLFNSIQRMLVRGFSTLEITKYKGETTYDVQYEIMPAGGAGAGAAT